MEDVYFLYNNQILVSRELALLNKNLNDLKNDLGNIGENKLLLITAVKVMDEYYETKKKC